MPQLKPNLPNAGTVLRLPGKLYAARGPVVRPGQLDISLHADCVVFSVYHGKRRRGWFKIPAEDVIQLTQMIRGETPASPILPR